MWGGGAGGWVGGWVGGQGPYIRLAEAAAELRRNGGVRALRVQHAMRLQHVHGVPARRGAGVEATEDPRAADVVVPQGQQHRRIALPRQTESAPAIIRADGLARVRAAEHAVHRLKACTRDLVALERGIETETERTGEKEEETGKR